PPLLVAGVEIVGGDAPHLLEFKNWNAADRRRGSRLERAGARVGGDVRLRPRKRAEKAAAVVRLTVAVFRTRILLDFDRAQAALAAHVEHARLRIGRGTTVDVHAAAGP